MDAHEADADRQFARPVRPLPRAPRRHRARGRRVRAVERRSARRPSGCCGQGEARRGGRADHDRTARAAARRRGCWRPCATISDFAQERRRPVLPRRRGAAQQAVRPAGRHAAPSSSLCVGLSSGAAEGRSRRPLDGPDPATERSGEGDLDARSAYAAANEFGDAGRLVQRHGRRRSRRERRSARTRPSSPASCSARKSCTRSAGSAQGAAAAHRLAGGGRLLAERGEDRLRALRVHRAGRRARARSFSAADLEGEFGAALATRQIQHITRHPGGHALRASPR